ncbi:MAG TPA: hypothetical protein VK395_06430 [Gemmataceae bacterium]|nr:hypothetical protein [Gemmataceae bacterium]
MPSIQDGPHYEIQSSELAGWLEQQGVDLWWNVDGDPLLTGRLTFPCPADELSAELRKLNRALLVQAPKGDPEAKGQSIDASKVSGMVARFAGNLTSAGPLPEWANDRLFYLCWKGSPHEWLLAEDSVTAKQFREEVLPKAK